MDQHSGLPKEKVKKRELLPAPEMSVTNVATM